MRLLLTRPAEDAEETARRLAGLGHVVVRAPMLEIALDPAVELGAPPEHFGAVALTSPRAVDGLAAREDVEVLRRLPVFAVGDRTAQRALAAGFGDVRSAGGDVLALAGLIGGHQSPASGPVLYACGRDRRGNLEDRLRQAGFTVHLAEVYRAEASPELSKQAVEALAAGRIDAVLVYSARTAEAFIAAMRRADLCPVLGRLRVLAISPAAAQPFAGLGVASVETAQRPDEAALLDLVVIDR